MEESKEKNPNDSVVETKSVSSDHGELTWTISGDLLQDMKEAKNKERFVGAPLRIGESNWRIEIYPNGWKDNRRDEGSFAVFIKNVSLAPKFKHFIICREIRCNELDVGEVFVKQYEHGVVNGWSDYTMTLPQIQRYQSLSFSISIKILKQTMKFQDKIYYQRKIKCPSVYTFRWNITRSLLKRIQDAVNGNQFCSPIYDGIWAVAIRPNGKSFADKGWCRVTLKLCGLPSKVKEITVNWNAVAILKYKDEYKQDKKVDVDKTHTFDLLDKNQYNWGGKKLKFSEIKKCKSLQIIIKSMVMSQYDDKGNDLMAGDHAKWDNHVQPPQHDDIVHDKDTKKAEISGIDEFQIMSIINKKFEDFSSAKLREIEKMFTSKMAEITKISKDRFDSLETKMKTDIIHKMSKMEQEITNISTDIATVTATTNSKQPKHAPLSQADKDMISNAAKKSELEDAMKQLGDMKSQIKQLSNFQTTQNQEIKDLKHKQQQNVSPSPSTSAASTASNAASDEKMHALETKIERVKKGLAQLAVIRKDIHGLKDEAVAMDKSIQKLREAESRSNDEELGKMKKEMKELRESYRADKRLKADNKAKLGAIQTQIEKQSKMQEKHDVIITTMQDKIKKHDQVKKEDVTSLIIGADEMKQNIGSLRKKLDKLAKKKGDDGLKSEVDKLEQQMKIMMVQQTNQKDAALKGNKKIHDEIKKQNEKIKANKDHLDGFNEKLDGIQKEMEKLVKVQKSLESEMEKVGKLQQPENVDIGPLKAELDGLKKDMSNLTASMKKENEALLKQNEAKLKKLQDKNKDNFAKMTNRVENAKNFTTMKFNGIKDDVEKLGKAQREQQQTLSKAVQKNTKSIQTLIEQKPKTDVESLETNFNLLRTQVVNLEESVKKAEREKEAEKEAMAQHKKSLQLQEVDDEKEETDEQRKIKKWFKDTVKLPQYAQIFINSGYQELESIGDVTMDKMVQIGVKSGKHRDTIYTCASLLQHKMVTPKTVQKQHEQQAQEQKKKEPVVVAEKPKKKKSGGSKKWLCDICGAHNPGDVNMCADCGVDRE